MNSYPMPPPSSLRGITHGFGRARLIRDLYAERCSVSEIADWLHVDEAEVRRTVRRPVRPLHVPHQRLAA